MPSTVMNDYSSEFVEAVLRPQSHVRVLLYDSIALRRSYALLTALSALKTSTDGTHQEFKCLIITSALSRPHWKLLCRDFGFENVRIINSLSYRQARKRVRLSDSIWTEHGIRVVSLDFIKNQRRFQECLDHRWNVVVFDEIHLLNTDQRSSMANAVWASENVGRVIGTAPGNSDRPCWKFFNFASKRFDSPPRRLVAPAGQIELAERADSPTALAKVAQSIDRLSSIDRMKAKSRPPVRLASMMKNIDSDGWQLEGDIRPIYAKLRDTLLSMTLALLEEDISGALGVVAKGVRLPSELELTGPPFNVSRTTARKALESLRVQGLVSRERSGSYLLPEALNKLSTNHLIPKDESAGMFLENPRVSGDNASNEGTEFKGLFLREASNRRYSERTGASVDNETIVTKWISDVCKQLCLGLKDPRGETASLLGIYGAHGTDRTHLLDAVSVLLSGRSNANIPTDIDLLPHQHVRLGILDEKKSYFTEGHESYETNHKSTPWGDLAYQLAGQLGYQMFCQSSGERTLPSHDAISLLLKGGPTLILLDEFHEQLSIKDPKIKELFEKFLLVLFDVVQETPNVVLIFISSSHTLGFEHEGIVKFQAAPDFTFSLNARHGEAIRKIMLDLQFDSPMEAIEWVFDRGINAVQTGTDSQSQKF